MALQNNNNNKNQYEEMETRSEIKSLNAHTSETETKYIQHTIAFGVSTRYKITIFAVSMLCFFFHDYN